MENGQRTAFAQEHILNRTHKPIAELTRCINDYLQLISCYGTTMLFSVRNGLKEDALVDIPNTLTMPQLILIMSLFTLLIGWLIIFAYLALRPMPEAHVEQLEHTAP